MKPVAEWLRCWTRDLAVWGSIPAVPVMCKSLGQALNPHRLCPPSSNGYQVERKLVLCEWLQLQKIALHSPQGDETIKFLGVNNVKSAEPVYGDIWTINIHLYLYLLYTTYLWCHDRAQRRLLLLEILMQIHPFISL